MPRLFGYGTLRDEAVQGTVFGRRLSGRADELHGFERGTVAIDEVGNVAIDEPASDASATGGTTTGDPSRAVSTYPILRYDGKAGSRVEGTVFEIDHTELERADRYEGAAYRRIEVELASGTMAWVYVDPRALPP